MTFAMRASVGLWGYLLALLIFVILKRYHQWAGTDDVLFLLYPVNALVSLGTGAASFYKAGEGFYYPVWNLYIDKSCAGFNFWLLCFGALVLALMPVLGRQWRYLWGVFLLLGLAWLVAVPVNASRILILMVLQRAAPHEPWLAGTVVHEGLGVLLYLGSLIIVYYTARKFSAFYDASYEKHAQS